MLKELAYRAAHRVPARFVVSQLRSAVRMPFGESGRSAEARRVLLVVTVDTEGGYVERSERRVWQGRAPRAFQGYVDGIRNVVAVLDRHRAKGTFLVAPHGRSATGATLVEVERAIRSIPGGGHEIGLHIHPTSDVALASRVGKAFTSGSARDLGLDDLERLVLAGRTLLEEILDRGTPLEAFRWGNWALDERAAVVVSAAGFRVDSSCVPGLRDATSRRNPRFDWTRSRTIEPWTIAPGLLEIPIAMFRVFGRLLRADPLYGPLLPAALRRYASHGPAAQRPLVFVVMTHTTEATYADGSPTRVLRALDDLLAFAREGPGIEVVTLGEAARELDLASGVE
jgi:peptidoglycan/xylan/chitin deacetylase (PgdA/CDA1 family)